MTNAVKENIPILVIILILGLYLGVKAFDENGWDGWGFASAQVIMSNEYWIRDGFIKNYFLQQIYPYSKLTKYLDYPEFRNRPIDTMNGSLTRGRIYYTHYPPLYLVPYFILQKMGVAQRALLRIFALFISLLALYFFYRFMRSVSDKKIATIASIYYGFSITFLNYADSVQTPPWSALSMFLIMTLSVVARRNFENRQKYRQYNLIIWGTYFISSLLSYDATFYIFGYLVLFDVFILKKFLWRKWLFLASAPILGFALQIIQNVWYLGWHEMISDLSRVYAERTFRGVKNFIVGLIAPFYSMASLKTVFIFKKTIVTLASLMAIFGIIWKFRQKIKLDSDYFKIVLILAMAAVIQPLFINATGGWPYQGVIAAPFWGLLIGAASIFIIDIFKRKESEIYKTVPFAILVAVVAMLWSTQFYGTLTYAKDWPNNRPNQKIIDFSKTIRLIEPEKEKIAFRIMPQDPIWKNQFPIFYFEYYLGMLKIDFANNNDLLTDFWWLRKISKHPYYSFVIADNKTEIENLRNEIKKKLPNGVSEVRNIQGQYVFVVNPD